MKPTRKLNLFFVCISTPKFSTIQSVLISVVSLLCLTYVTSIVNASDDNNNTDEKQVSIQEGLSGKALKLHQSGKSEHLARSPHTTPSSESAMSGSFNLPVRIMNFNPSVPSRLSSKMFDSNGESGPP